MRFRSVPPPRQHRHLGPHQPQQDSKYHNQVSDSRTMQWYPIGFYIFSLCVFPSFFVPVPTILPPPSGSPGSATSPQRPPPHKIVGSGDEHHVLTTPHGQLASGIRQQQQQQQQHLAPVGSLYGGPPRKPYNYQPKFKQVMTEYVGACMEDNCNIGRRKPIKKKLPGKEI